MLGPKSESVSSGIVRTVADYIRNTDITNEAKALGSPGRIIFLLVISFYFAARNSAAVVEIDFEFYGFTALPATARAKTRAVTT